jgi:hypothetical protein
VGCLRSWWDLQRLFLANSNVPGYSVAYHFLFYRQQLGCSRFRT